MSLIDGCVIVSTQSVWYLSLYVCIHGVVDDEIGDWDCCNSMSFVSCEKNRLKL
jgi:hypothetical protein